MRARPRACQPGAARVGFNDDQFRLTENDPIRSTKVKGRWPAALGITVSAAVLLFVAGELVASGRGMPQLSHTLDQNVV